MAIFLCRHTRFKRYPRCTWFRRLTRIHRSTWPTGIRSAWWCRATRKPRQSRSTWLVRLHWCAGISRSSWTTGIRRSRFVYSFCSSDFVI